MNTVHLKEEEIQQYALDIKIYPPSVIAHLESCSVCRAELETYRLLFSGLTHQPVPVFHFDLPAAVMTRLPKSRPSISADHVVASFLVIFSLVCLAFPLYYFRGSLANLFMDMPPFFLFAIGISTSLILVIKILSLYKKYQNQVRFLNFN
jgi:hypothetical protein